MSMDDNLARLEDDLLRPPPPPEFSTPGPRQLADRIQDVLRVGETAPMLAPLAAVRAVLKIHKPEMVETIPVECIDGACEHSEAGDECPENHTETCQDCYALASQWNEEAPVMAYPCPTVKAIANALGVSP